MKKTGKTTFLSKFLFVVAFCCLAVCVSCSDGDSGGFSDMSQQIASWQEQTFQGMYAVNSRDAVFARHKNFLVQTDVTEAGLELGMFRNSMYSEVDCFYTEDDYTIGSELHVFDTFYTTSTICSRERTNAGSSIFVNFYAMTEAEKKAILPSTSLVNVVTDGRSLGEKLVSVVNNGNGTVTVTTGMPIAKSLDFSSGVPEKWKDGTMEYVSVLDAQSLELIRSVIFVVNKNERIQLYSQTISFDVAQSENFVSIRAFLEKYEKKEFTPTKTITAYYNYGTERQEKYEFQRDNSCRIWTVFRTDYSAFKDAAGTEPISDFDFDDADITIYFLENKTAWNKLYDRAVAVNSHEATFTNHSNYLVREVAEEGAESVGYGGGVKATSFFAEKNCWYSETDVSNKAPGMESIDCFRTTTGDWWRTRYIGGMESLISTWYIMPDSEKAKYVENADKISVMEDERPFGETILSVVYNNNGTFTMVTAEPVDKAPLLENCDVPEEWKNSYLETTYTFDSTTFEKMGAVCVVVTSEKRIPFLTQAFKYDAATPDGYASLKAFAAKVENKSFTPTKKLTAIYNPGTEQAETFVSESDASFTVRLVYRDGYALYTDPEGKTPVENLSGNDVTVYLIKKASSDPTLDKLYRDMVSVNSHDEIFTRHKNFFQSVVFGRAAEIAQVGEENSRIEYYVDGDCYYGGNDILSTDASIPFSDYIYTLNGSYAHERNGDTEKWYMEWYLMSDAERSAYIPDLKYVSIMGDGRALGETIVSAKDNGNGTITVVSSMPVETVPLLAHGIPDGWSGATMEFASLLDATTLEVKEIVTTLVNKGERVLFHTQKFSYDVQKTERCTALQAFAAKVEKKEFTPTKTLTAFYNYGTAQQEKFEYSRDASFAVSVIARDGYLPYKDAAGTEPFTDRIDSTENDVTVYLIKE